MDSCFDQLIVFFMGGTGDHGALVGSLGPGALGTAPIHRIWPTTSETIGSGWKRASRTAPSRWTYALTYSCRIQHACAMLHVVTCLQFLLCQDAPLWACCVLRELGLQATDSNGCVEILSATMMVVGSLGSWSIVDGCVSGTIR